MSSSRPFGVGGRGAMSGLERSSGSSETTETQDSETTSKEAQVAETRAERDAARADPANWGWNDPANAGDPRDLMGDPEPWTAEELAAMKAAEEADSGRESGELQNQPQAREESSPAAVHADGGPPTHADTGPAAGIEQTLSIPDDDPARAAAQVRMDRFANAARQRTAAWSEPTRSEITSRLEEPGPTDLPPPTDTTGESGDNAESGAGTETGTDGDQGGPVIVYDNNAPYNPFSPTFAGHDAGYVSVVDVDDDSYLPVPDYADDDIGPGAVSVSREPAGWDADSSSTSDDACPDTDGDATPPEADTTADTAEVSPYRTPEDVREAFMSGKGASQVTRELRTRLQNRLPNPPQNSSARKETSPSHGARLRTTTPGSVNGCGPPRVTRFRAVRDRPTSSMKWWERLARKCATRATSFIPLPYSLRRRIRWSATRSRTADRGRGAAHCWTWR